jgi:hypothetical protein
MKHDLTNAVTVRYQAEFDLGDAWYVQIEDEDENILCESGLACFPIDLTKFSEDDDEELYNALCDEFSNANVICCS